MARARRSKAPTRTSVKNIQIAKQEADRILKTLSERPDMRLDNAYKLSEKYREAAEQAKERGDGFSAAHYGELARKLRKRVTEQQLKNAILLEKPRR